jgi:hypothetical protein
MHDTGVELLVLFALTARKAEWISFLQDSSQAVAVVVGEVLPMQQVAPSEARVL